MSLQSAYISPTLLTESDASWMVADSESIRVCSAGSAGCLSGMLATPIQLNVLV